MTTPAKMALDLVSDGLIIVDVVHSYECGSRHNGDCICDAKNNSKYISTIRAALKMMDAVQSGRLERCHPIRDRANGVYSSGSYKVDGWNDCLDHLKQIAGE